MKIDTYWTYICPHCPLKADCTTGSERRVRRWEHEAVLKTVQRRLDRNPDAMKVQRRGSALLTERLHVSRSKQVFSHNLDPLQPDNISRNSGRLLGI